MRHASSVFFALSGYHTIAAAVAGAMFLIALVWFVKSPHGEQAMAVSVAICNLFAFGAGGILMKMWPEVVAYAMATWVIIGVILQVSLTQACKKGRL